MTGSSACRTDVRTSIRDPQPLSDADIEAAIASYVACAKLAARAGYDGVEIMGSEGYLINQFTAPRTNNRTDRWGGTLENRLRFPREIVSRIRATGPPEFLILFRISAIDLVEDGLTSEEICEQARVIAGAGADVINTGIGGHEARVPTIAASVPRAAYAFAVRRIRDNVDAPVIPSNRINTPEVAESLIADGVCDLVSMARPMLAHPDFARKVEENRGDEINTCIACNQACLDLIFADCSTRFRLTSQPASCNRDVIRR